jgi:predicted AlkP superfamily phosphohydrolase/phosphomutase
MKNNTKVFVIGLDGATWKVLNPLIKKGKLGFFKKMKESGASGILKSTTPPLTAPAWVSFQTSVNPGKHGVFGFLDYRRNKANPTVFDSKDIKQDKLWEILGNQSFKSLVINMPMTYPLKRMDGILVSSFLTPPGEKFVYPKRYQKVLDRIDYKVDLLIEKKYGWLPERRLSAKERKNYLEKLILLAEKRVKAFKILSSKDSFSFLFLLFKETDLAQHLFWGQKELADFYENLDALLEEIFNYYYKNFKGEKSFILISDHGFHATADTEFVPYQWLRENSFLRDEGSGRELWRKMSAINKTLKKSGITPTQLEFFRRLKNKLLSKGMRDEVKKEGVLVTPEGLYLFGESINQRQTTVNNIIKLLKKLRYKNKPVFRLVEKSSKIYWGPYSELGPDIAWMPEESFSINTSPFADKVFTKREKILPGEHIADLKGIFLANGPLFPKVSNQDLSIYDMYPLILYLLGAKVPVGIDGKVPSFVTQNAKITDERKIIKRLIDKEIKDLKRYG